MDATLCGGASAILRIGPRARMAETQTRPPETGGRAAQAMIVSYQGPSICDAVQPDSVAGSHDLPEDVV